ncbi:MAG: P-II family nitrogen regulator [Sphaerochaetaceae bacterium]
MSNVLILAIVQKGKAQAMIAQAKLAGSDGGTILFARGTASSSLLSVLGLGDSHKEVLLVLAAEEKCEAIIHAMEEVPRLCGLIATVNCTRSFLQQTTCTSKKEPIMEGEWEIINVICNQGYAEEIMEAARNAGAGGGTVLNGRGTGTPDDVKFFGTSLVPEKEMLLILVDKQKVDGVFTAITSLSCLHETGSGIVYTLPVSNFKILGE